MASPPAATALPDFAQDLGHGVYAIDTAFQRDHFDAAYLVVDNGHAAVIDTGPRFAVPRILATLAALGLGVEAVDWVIPTHVHLDHAGGAGTLMRELPRAQALVHPRGARHMIDPSALYQGALAVYGAEEMARSYGELDGIPAERVQTTHDGQRVPLGGRELLIHDAPGHARHHNVIWDPVSRGWFTGDTFGISYRELDINGRPWIFPTTTPVQFEPALLRASVERMLSFQPDSVYLTHFGKLGDVATLGAAQLKLLEQVVQLGEGLRHLAGAERHAALLAGLSALYLADLHAQGSTLDAERFQQLMGLDVELNAQGMGNWLDRLNKEARA